MIVVKPPRLKIRSNFSSNLVPTRRQKEYPFFSFFFLKEFYILFLCLFNEKLVNLKFVCACLSDSALYQEYIGCFRVNVYWGKISNLNSTKPRPSVEILYKNKFFFYCIIFLNFHRGNFTVPNISNHFVVGT